MAPVYLLEQQQDLKRAHEPSASSSEGANAYQSESKVELGVEERRLIQLLQRNNQLTNAQLASKANLSPPTCLRRLRRLRSERVIVGDVSLVDPTKLGKGLTAFVQITLERTNEPMLRAFENKVAAEPDIMQCYRVSGDTDYLLMMLAADTAALRQLIGRIFASDRNILRFRTLCALHTTKFKTEVSVD
ncbi:MAG: Lrp/AsnC family transcriptional regulator [Alphaproteobacteria bacterium]